MSADFKKLAGKRERELLLLFDGQVKAAVNECGQLTRASRAGGRACSPKASQTLLAPWEHRGPMPGPRVVAIPPSSPPPLPTVSQRRRCTDALTPRANVCAAVSLPRMRPVAQAGIEGACCNARGGSRTSCGLLLGAHVDGERVGHTHSPEAHMEANRTLKRTAAVLLQSLDRRRRARLCGVVARLSRVWRASRRRRDSRNRSFLRRKPRPRVVVVVLFLPPRLLVRVPAVRARTTDDACHTAAASPTLFLAGGPY
ncbi:hypothetical protein HPB47_023527 [Ixodes persulcatus]|uniref:Uncharacterized protein n=1 Tax=Ixodes persulcatus TaxID=34615 RepID=A0AC60Q6S9_IXOPE|nr:hypothetical protein HPB47_023527 [Ixodes persulcatus]